ncbi:MAG TPA: dihydrofolate reductase family protein [Terricaulis sp.]|nr:dihydrofolate reductase family protein [Terricaulis sp.]
MAKIIFGMNVSLDGFVDHDKFAPGPELFSHWIAHVRELAGSLYGRRMYEIMAYWDEDHPEWGPAEHEFAQAWRAMPKWVASRTLNAVGPNAELIAGDVVAAMRDLKTRQEGEISVSGPNLAQTFIAAGLIDEYRLYLHPLTLGHGARFFAAAPPPLRLLGHEHIGESVVRLRYAPAA